MFRIAISHPEQEPSHAIAVVIPISLSLYAIDVWPPTGPNFLIRIVMSVTAATNLSGSADETQVKSNLSPS